MGAEQGTGGVRPAIVVAGDDLLFASQIAASLAALGYHPLIAGTPDAFSTSLAPASPGGSRPVAAILNLASFRFDAIAAIRLVRSQAATRGIRLLGFCGHADTARRQAAQASGCDLVATNGEVGGHLGRLIAQLLPAPAVPPASDR